MKENPITKNLGWMGAGVSAVLPGISFFTSYTPPLFPSISIITFALAGFIVFGVAQGKVPHGYRSRRVAYRAMAASVAGLVLYMILLQVSTVLDPQAGHVRCQIGIWNVDQSLTALGLKVKAYSPDPPDWMMADALFGKCKSNALVTTKFWTMSSFLAAGGTLIVSYILAFVGWTYAFATMAKYPSIDGEPVGTPAA